MPQNNPGGGEGTGPGCGITEVLACLPAASVISRLLPLNLLSIYGSIGLFAGCFRNSAIIHSLGHTPMLHPQTVRRGPQSYEQFPGQMNRGLNVRV